MCCFCCCYYSKIRLNKKHQHHLSASLSEFNSASKKSSKSTLKPTIINNNSGFLNSKGAKLSVNQISHYITIIILGFYFILSTIPYAIILSVYNNLTTKLEYNLPTKERYINDSLWIKYGIYRDVVVIFRLFFNSNHSLNFFFYLLFNRLFREEFYGFFFQRIVKFSKNLSARDV
jgi:hypothetical protein